jgi:hypothetical protein
MSGGNDEVADSGSCDSRVVCRDYGPWRTVLMGDARRGAMRVYGWVRHDRVTSVIGEDALPPLNVDRFNSRCSGTIQFFKRVQALLRPRDIVSDFGAGRGVDHGDILNYAGETVGNVGRLSDEKVIFCECSCPCCIGDVCAL